MLDHSRAFIYRKTVELPVIFRMSQPDSWCAQSPGVGKLGDENIGNIVGFLGPEDIVFSPVIKVSMIQREICKCNISCYSRYKRSLLLPFSGQGIGIFIRR